MPMVARCFYFAALVCRRADAWALSYSDRKHLALVQQAEHPKLDRKANGTARPVDRPFKLWNLTARVSAVVCVMPKVASTSLLAITANIWNENAIKMLFARRSHLIKAILLRHPVSRFVSWYNDKILGLNQAAANRTEWFNYLLLGIGQLTYTRMHGGNASTGSRRGNPLRGSVAGGDATARTPLAYARSLARSGTADVEKHVRSFSAACLLAHVRYDVVGRLENVSAFLDALGRRAGGRVSLPHLAAAPPAVHTTQQAPGRRLLREADLSCETLAALGEAYADDLKAFRRMGVPEYVASPSGAPCRTEREIASGS